MANAPPVYPQLIVDPERGVLKSLLPQLNSPSLIRRRGIAGMLYNCSFVVENEERAKFLMSSDLDLLPQVMFCLMGPEELETEDVCAAAAENVYATTHRVICSAGQACRPRVSGRPGCCQRSRAG